MTGQATLTLTCSSTYLTFLGLGVYDFQSELVRQSDLLLFHNGIFEVRKGYVEAIKRDLLVIQTALELEVNTGHLANRTRVVEFKLTNG